MESNEILIRCIFIPSDTTISKSSIFCLLSNLDYLNSWNPNDKNSGTLYDDNQWVWLFNIKVDTVFEFKLTQCQKDDFQIERTESTENSHNFRVPQLSPDQAISINLKWELDYEYEIVQVDDILNENEDLFEKLTLNFNENKSENNCEGEKEENILKSEENHTMQCKISPKIKFKVTSESLDSICGSSSEIEEILFHQNNKFAASNLLKTSSSDILSSSSDKRSSESIFKVDELPENEVFNLPETESDFVNIDTLLPTNDNSDKSQNQDEIILSSSPTENVKSKSDIFIAKIHALLGFRVWKHREPYSTSETGKDEEIKQRYSISSTSASDSQISHLKSDGEHQNRDKHENDNDEQYIDELKNNLKIKSALRVFQKSVFDKKYNSDHYKNVSSFISNKHNRHFADHNTENEIEINVSDNDLNLVPSTIEVNIDDNNGNFTESLNIENQNKIKQVEVDTDVKHDDEYNEKNIVSVENIENINPALQPKEMFNVDSIALENVDINKSQSVIKSNVVKVIESENISEKEFINQFGIENSNKIEKEETVSKDNLNQSDNINRIKVTADSKNEWDIKIVQSTDNIEHIGLKNDCGSDTEIENIKLKVQNVNSELKNTGEDIEVKSNINIDIKESDDLSNINQLKNNIKIKENTENEKNVTEDIKKCDVNHQFRDTLENETHFETSATENILGGLEKFNQFKNKLDIAINIEYKTNETVNIQNSDKLKTINQVADKVEIEKGIVKDEPSIRGSISDDLEKNSQFREEIDNLENVDDKVSETQNIQNFDKFDKINQITHKMEIEKGVAKEESNIRGSISDDLEKNSQFREEIDNLENVDDKVSETQNIQNSDKYDKINQVTDKIKVAKGIEKEEINKTENKLDDMEKISQFIEKTDNLENVDNRVSETQNIQNRICITEDLQSYKECIEEKLNAKENLQIFIGLNKKNHVENKLEIEKLIKDEEIPENLKILNEGKIIKSIIAREERNVKEEKSMNEKNCNIDIGIINSSNESVNEKIYSHDDDMPNMTDIINSEESFNNSITVKTGLSDELNRIQNEEFTYVQEEILTVSPGMNELGNLFEEFDCKIVTEESNVEENSNFSNLVKGNIYSLQNHIFSANNVQLNKMDYSNPKTSPVPSIKINDDKFNVIVDDKLSEEIQFQDFKDSHKLLMNVSNQHLNYDYDTLFLMDNDILLSASSSKDLIINHQIVIKNYTCSASCINKLTNRNFNPKTDQFTTIKVESVNLNQNQEKIHQCDVKCNESSSVRSSLSKKCLLEKINIDNLCRDDASIQRTETKNDGSENHAANASVVTSQQTSIYQTTNEITGNKLDGSTSSNSGIFTSDSVAMIEKANRLENPGCWEIQFSDNQSHNETSIGENVCPIYNDNNKPNDTHLSSINETVSNPGSDNYHSIELSAHEQFQIADINNNSIFHDDLLENCSMLNPMLCLFLSNSNCQQKTQEHQNPDLIFMHQRQCQNNKMSVETSINSYQDSAVICDSDVNSDSQSAIGTIVQDESFEDCTFNNLIKTSQTVDSLFISAFSSNKQTISEENEPYSFSIDSSHEIIFDDTQMSLKNKHSPMSPPTRPTQYCSLPIPPRSGMKRSPALEGVCDLLSKTDSELNLIQQKIYILINDDDLYPDALTPTKADSTLRMEGSVYDIPYIDDDAFNCDNLFKPFVKNCALAKLATYDECILGSSNDISSTSSLNNPHNLSIVTITKKKSKMQDRFFKLCGCLSRNRN